MNQSNQTLMFAGSNNILFRVKSGVMFTTDQSATMVKYLEALKTGALVRLVSILYCLAYNWTVKDE